MKTFVFVKEEITTENLVIKKNEIGILNEDFADKDFVKVRFVNSDEEVLISNLQIEKFDYSQTGDQFPKKVCNVCNRLLDTNKFSKNQNGKNNRTVRRPSCDECRIKIDGKNVSIKDKKEWERKKPNLIVWECPICKKRTIPGLTSKVVLDHDHITGKPRAWICDSCNTGLGRFKDDIQTIQNAIKYLEENKEKEL